MKITNSTKRKTVLAGLVGLFAAGGMTQAVAQGGEAATGQSAIDEIIVTATKREQSLQDTAMSISAIGGEEIERRGLVGMNDYLRTLPGVSMIDRGAGRNGVVMRGVTADPQSEGFFNGPTVGIYLGETPLTVRGIFGTADIKMIDLDRVEVLRGPQGTLYGASSLGGTVRNIPNAPNLREFEGSITGGYSTTSGNGSGNHKLEGVINIPLIEDQLAVRIVGYTHENSGFINNTAASDPTSSAAAISFGAENLAVDRDGVGGDEVDGGRITVLWRPTDSVNATLMHLKQDLLQDGMNEVEVDLDTFDQTRLQLGNIIGGGERLIGNIEVTNLELEIDLGWASLLSSSSWMEGESDRIRDLGIFFGDAPIPQANLFDTEAFVEELRLTSSLDGPLQFIAGYFYSDSEVIDKIDIFWGGDDADDNFLDVGNFVLLDGVDTSVVEQSAFFGEVSYAFNNELTLTVGARIFDYETEDGSLWQPGYFTGGGLVNSLEKGEDDGTSYKVNLSYLPSENSTFYFNWAEGFRLGKAFVPLPASTCDLDDDGILDGTNAPIDLNLVGPDTIESFEIGGKLTLSDGKLVVNSSVYRNNWDDIPVNVIGTCALSIIANAGKAVTQGFEVESSFYATPNLKLNIGASYIDAKLVEDAISLGGSDGDRLPGSPDKTFNLGLEYRFNVSNHPAYIQTNYAWVSGFYNNFKETGFEAGNYSEINLKAGITIDQITVNAFVNNLTDTDEFTWIDNLLPGYANRLRPRTIGFILSYVF